MRSNTWKTLLKMTALFLCTAIAALLIALIVSAVQFGELGRIMVYGFLTLVCLELIVVLASSLRKRDNT